MWWIKNGLFLNDKIKALRKEAPDGILTDETQLFEYIDGCGVVEWGPDMYFRGESVDVKCDAQPVVNKKPSRYY